MNKNEHSIGKTIAKLRAEKGWTQARLARELCVEDKTISRWECEEGFPSITSLPQIAEVFDITIDYLLTGKCSEPVVIIASIKEECAKNDDLELFNSIDKASLTSKDENGKTLFDYIFTYFPQKVMRAYYDAVHPRDVRLDLILGTLHLPWNPSSDGRIVVMSRSHTDKDDIWADYRSLRYSSGVRPKDLYYEELFDFIVTNFERINKSSLNLYLSQFRSATDKLFKRAIDLLPNENGEAIVEYLLNFTEEYNSKKYHDYDESKEYYRIYLSKHADDLLDKGFIELAQNCDKNLDSSKIELAKLKKQGKDNTKAAQVLKYEQNGVLDIEELIKTNDYELIEAAFKKHENILNGKATRLNGAKEKYKIICLKHGCYHFSPLNSAMLYEPRSFSCLSYPYDMGYYIHPTMKTIDEAVCKLNKCLKNNILAVVYARTKRNEFSKDYKMSYICDFYNRHLYEECINASYNKLKEFFEIACHLTGSIEEMLDKYYMDFEPGCIYETYNDGENIHIVSERLIKDVMQEIITAYNMLQVDSYNPKVLSEDCLNLLGKIFNEPVYIDRPDDDWEY